MALAAIAARPSRIRLGELVVGVPYRNPALLAKMLTTLDVVAHGRTIIGLGAAWHDEEFVPHSAGGDTEQKAGQQFQRQTQHLASALNRCHYGNSYGGGKHLVALNAPGLRWPG